MKSETDFLDYLNAAETVLSVGGGLLVAGKVCCVGTSPHPSVHSFKWAWLGLCVVDVSKKCVFSCERGLF